MSTDDQTPVFESDARQQPPEKHRSKVKFEVYGIEIIEKNVKASGNSGRVYLPPNWVGKNVKVVRVD